jgi:hypothetical protein
MDRDEPRREPLDYDTFEARMRAFEDGPFTTNFEQLQRLGVVLPEPDAMDDATLTAKLWEVLRQLGTMGVFLESTDHLDDRRLYTLMWNETLRTEVPDIEPDPDECWHVDLVSTGSAENVELYLRYYADETARQAWLDQFPDDPIPPHEEPPYDRDRLLDELYDALDGPPH